MALQQITEGITGQQAAEIIFNNDDFVLSIADKLEKKIEKRSFEEYNTTLPFRVYSTDNLYVTVRSQVVQENTNDYDILTHNVSASSSLAIYFNTPVLSAVREKAAYCIEGKILNITAPPSVSYAFGFGWGKVGEESDVFGGLMYRTSGTGVGDISSLAPYTETVRNSGLPGLSIGDVVRFNVYISANQQRVNVYLNEVLIATVNYPIPIDANFQMFLRGGLSVSFSKISEVQESFAPISVVKEVDDIKSLINKNHPFKSDATFVRGSISYSWMKNFIKDIKLFGFPLTDRISLFLVRRNSANPNKYQLDFYRDTGDGSGNSSARELVLSWVNPGFVEPVAGQYSVIEHHVGTVGFKAYIDWSKAPVGDTGTINYNAAGFAQEVYINFSASNITPQPIGDVRLLWQYNNTDAPTTGTSLYHQFTVVANVDAGAEKVACTGATYNTNTKEYVIAYFARARASKLYFYKRSDLTDYTNIGTLLPTPTRVMDVTEYLYNLQGITYDSDLNCYWLLGSENPVGVGTDSILVCVDDEGYLLEKYLLPFDFAPGMLAMSPDNKNLMIKPGNRSLLWEINKTTKQLFRQVPSIPYEGLGVSPDGFVWVAGDNGVLRKMNYSDMSVIYEIPFETLPDIDGISQNTEGIIYDPIDGALCFVADAYYHRAHNNGNCMWVFDFEQTIKKSLRFPEMFQINDNRESQIFDFDGYEATLENVQIINGDVNISYRGSNTAPTLPRIERQNWRDLPFYENWGTTVPGEWGSDVPENTRYVQIKITAL